MENFYYNREVRSFVIFSKAGFLNEYALHIQYVIPYYISSMLFQNKSIKRETGSFGSHLR